MSEEIINALGRRQSSRRLYTSSLRFKGKALDTAAIGRDLNVSWLLEGACASPATWSGLPFSSCARVTDSVPGAVASIGDWTISSRSRTTLPA